LNLALLPLTPPVITSAPSPRHAQPGQIIAFTVSADSLAPPTYQWRRNGVPLSDRPGHSFGANTHQFILLNAQPADIGAYTVEVCNAAGAAVSAPAGLVMDTPFTLTVLPGPGGPETPFAFAVGGPVGGQCAVEFSTNLLDWSALGTFSNATGILPLSDPGSEGEPRRFYRARSLP
jgi:hypothetical protein